MKSESPGQTVTRFLIDHARLVCCLFILATAACAWLARSFEINASADTLLEKDNPLYLETRIYNQRFFPEEFILVAYRPLSTDLYAPANLENIQALAAELATLERVEKVNAVTNVPLISAGVELTPDLDVGSLTWEQSRYPADEMRAILDGHPIYSNLLVNSAQTATALQVVFRGNDRINAIEQQLLPLIQVALDDALSASQREQMEALELEKAVLEKTLAGQRRAEVTRIYDITAPYREEAEIHLGGTHVLAYHLVDIISNDLVVFGLAIAGIISVVLLVLFRDWRWLCLPLLCCLVSVLMTTGLFGALGMEATVISSNFIALQLILTLAIVIHLILHYQYLGEIQPECGHHDLLVKTVAEKASPCFFAGLTTSVGFAALLISNLQPVIAFGVMMIVAMAVSIAVSLVLFPCVLALSSRRLPVRRPALVGTLLDRIHGLVAARPGVIVVMSCMLAIVLAAGIYRLDAENSFINYFSESTRIRQELTFIDTQLGGSTPLDIIYHPQATSQESEDLVLESQRARTLQAIQESLETSTAVGKVMSVINFTHLAQILNEGLPLTEYELNNLYILLDDKLRDSLLGDYVNASRDEYRINARIIDSTPELDRESFLQALRQIMTNLEISEEDYSLTNLFVIYQDILMRLFDSQIKTMGLVFAALWLVLLVVFRSPVIAAIALVPNVIVSVFILGLMGWLGIPLDLMTITITAIAMGIAVDDTIHFVHHFMHEKGQETAERSQRTFHIVGFAVLYTSLVIALGFSVLGLSDFVPSIVFGLLTCVAMLVALVIALTLLPVLLGAHADWRNKRIKGVRVT